MFAPKIARPQTKMANGSMRKPQSSTLAHRFGRDSVDHPPFLQRTERIRASLRFLEQQGFSPPGKNDNDVDQEGGTLERMMAREGRRARLADMPTTSLRQRVE
jgi:hypothetical protein